MFKKNLREIDEKSFSELIFHTKKSIQVSNYFLERLFKTKRGMRAKDLRLLMDEIKEKFDYSSRSFYGEILKTLKQLGFIAKSRIPLDHKYRWVYITLVNVIPAKNPSPGTFYGYAWKLSKKWNELAERGFVVGQGDELR
jgi:hypothetical protein